MRQRYAYNQGNVPRAQLNLVLPLELRAQIAHECQVHGRVQLRVRSKHKLQARNERVRVAGASPCGLVQSAVEVAHERREIGDNLGHRYESLRIRVRQYLRLAVPARPLHVPIDRCLIESIVVPHR